ncbi:hypothetical protein J1605_008107 [Eschrichtius robustus]|uniref:Uncharacterized protein n=1 Tax=Eschrichtius robustus TaxID=9764 RepID=A0AB34GZ93_ESCRO|nr:hypothetical protein J1605_008107 [Eschrichtius robustus]
MAAGSAPGWAVGALGVVCLLLRLGEWRPPPGARGDRQRGVSVAPGLRGRVDGRGPRRLQGPRCLRARRPPRWGGRAAVKAKSARARAHAEGGSSELPCGRKARASIQNS